MLPDETRSPHSLEVGSFTHQLFPFLMSKVIDLPDKQVMIFETDKERKVAEMLVEKGLVGYECGGYFLTKKGKKVAKEMKKRD